ncbi:unnamed protein product [Adineta steineri]|uniref:Uncharacterized protein n=1 Tax=Adineta steineri TaxID=433720 RepID=A0A819G6R5_9BILA|nr:unnamed protein product [Adineta steineri]
MAESQLYRIRQNHLPKSPITSDFVLHQGFTLTDQGARFLLYDSNAVEVPYAPAPASVGRLIIYSSDLQLQILSKLNVSRAMLPRTRLIGCAFHYSRTTNS